MSNQFRNIATAAATAAIAASIPALASAQTLGFSTSPVTVTSCSIDRSFDGSRFAGPLSFAVATPRTTSSVALRYINRGNVPATTVKILVTDGDYTQNIVATGTFAPGAQIDRSVEAGDIANVTKNADCTIAEVDFANGTAWHAAPRSVVNR